MSGLEIGGIPETSTINDLLPPYGMLFSQFLGGIFNPATVTEAPDLATDPMSTFTYMTNKANLKRLSAMQRPMVRVADKNLQIMGELQGEVSCDTEELMSDTGAVSIEVSMSNWLINWMTNEVTIDEDIHLLVDPIPTAPDWRTRWGGKVHQINLSYNDNGTQTAIITALAHREHAKHLLIADMPVLPPEVQLPRMWVLPGPVRTILFATFFINLARLFLPGLNTITNIFNPASWINPLNLSGLENINPLNWPIQVAFVNPILDQSRWTAIGASWTDWHTATGDLLKDCGVILRAYTWLTTDVDSPHTELTNIISSVEGVAIDLLDLLGLSSADDLVQTLGGEVIETIARPTRNCVVFSLEDMSGQSGPTGTAADGL